MLGSQPDGNEDGFPLTGTAASFGVTNTETSTEAGAPGQGQISVTETVVIKGSRSGSIVTLEVTFTRTETSIGGLPPGQGFNGDTSVTGTVTLQ